jgi:hypothetical protein
MNLKKLYLSTAVLAIAAILTYFVKNADTSQPEDPRIGATLATNDDLNQVAELELISGTESMTFQYDADASSWQLQERYNLPADTQKIANLTNQLKETTLQRVASRNPERIDDFGFGIDHINLHDDTGSSILALDLGRETDSGKQLVRFGQEELAFIASDSFSVDGDPVSWLDKTLIDVERDAIRSATFQLENGDTLSVTRTSDTADWTTQAPLPEGKRLDQGAITRALNRLVSINFIRLTDHTDPQVVGAQDHCYTVHYTLADDTTYTVTAGQRPEVKVEKEVETTNDAGETVTEMQEEVETPAGAVFVEIASSEPGAPINDYMDRTAFATTGALYTAAPKTLDALLTEIPEPEPESTSDTKDATQ